MSDMTQTITPKSDQLNSDDLIAAPMTIKITGVNIRGGQDQPVAISYEGDNGKPYKACKSMCRVMVMAWGADSKQYVGRSMTLYRDPKVKWAGLEVGGIRISHLSHIDSTLTLMLTATRGSKKPITILPLKFGAASDSQPGESVGPAVNTRDTNAAPSNLEINRAKAALRDAMVLAIGPKPMASAVMAWLAENGLHDPSVPLSELSPEETTALANLVRKKIGK